MTSQPKTKTCESCEELKALLNEQFDILNKMNTPAEERITALEFENAVLKARLEMSEDWGYEKLKARDKVSE